MRKRIRLASLAAAASSVAPVSRRETDASGSPYADIRDGTVHNTARKVCPERPFVSAPLLYAIYGSAYWQDGRVIHARQTY